MSLVYFNLAVNRAVEKSHFYTEERRSYLFSTNGKDNDTCKNTEMFEKK